MKTLSSSPKSGFVLFCLCAMTTSVLLSAANSGRCAATPQDGSAANESSEPDNDNAISSLIDLMASIDDPAFQLDLLKGVQEGLKGRRQLAMPTAWPAVYTKLRVSPLAEVQRRAAELAVKFGDVTAIAELKASVIDSQRPTESRQRALEILTAARIPNFVETLFQLLDDFELQRAALKSLAAYDHPQTGQRVLTAYDRFSAETKRVAADLLAARAGTAQLLMEAVANDRIPATDLNAEVIRKLQLLQDEQIQALIDEHWGVTRATPAEAAQRKAELTTELTAEAANPPNLFHGRTVFAQTCQQCHKLYGLGGNVGPDITGSNRNNLDYLLTNVVDPNALVGKDYQAWNVFTTDGQILVGLITAENNSQITLRTSTEEITIPQDEIEERSRSDVSMMPIGLLDKLTPQQRRNLVAYLASPVPVPKLAMAENQGDLFGGPTAAGWDVQGTDWQVGKGTLTLQTKTSLAKRQIAYNDMYLQQFTLRGQFDVADQSGQIHIQLQPVANHAETEPTDHHVGIAIIFNHGTAVIEIELPDAIDSSSNSVIAAPSVPLAVGTHAFAWTISPGQAQLQIDDRDAMPFAVDLRGGQLSITAEAGFRGKVTMNNLLLDAPTEAELLKSFAE
ncbi:MAG: c-type cytochrome [Planctomycetales bacterium]|nr:c-type cytochrome [Planctomycetales bacterium]